VTRYRVRRELDRSAFYARSTPGTHNNLLIASGTVWIFVEIVYFYGNDRLLKLQLEPFNYHANIRHTRQHYTSMQQLQVAIRTLIRTVSRIG
jgi:hypothetical protein